MLFKEDYVVSVLVGPTCTWLCLSLLGDCFAFNLYVFVLFDVLILVKLKTKTN